MGKSQPRGPAARAEDDRPVAVLTCGPAGAGKTTYAQGLERQGYVRLSHDTEVRRRFGRYGVDVPAERFEEYNDAVRPVVKERLAELLRQGRDVVVDLSFWRKADRDTYRAIVEAVGGRWRLVYFDVPHDVLRRRLRARRVRDDADAFPVSDELLARFLAGFEVSRGEEEEVVVVRDDVP